MARAKNNKIAGSVDCENKVLLEVKHLNKSYQKVEIIKDVSFDVHENEIIALLGPSGCGKSTILNILSGFLLPTSGCIKIRNQVLKGKNKYSVTVFQRSSCYNWLNLKDNIKFPLEHGNWKIKDKKEIEKKTSEALKRVGLADYGEYFPSQVSGGMQQRVSLARTMVSEAPLILMDEPFVGLDEQTKELMHMLVLDIWEEHKKTIVLITHDIQEALFIADKIYVLSARPAEVKAMVKVDLPRPRRPEIKFTEEFIRLEKFLNFATEREVIKASQIRIADLNPKSIKIGVFTWIGVAPFYIAKELNLFKKKGLDITLVQIEKNDDRSKALNNGDVDLLDTTFDRFLLDRQKNDQLKIISLLNRSNGGDALVVRNDIKNIKNLVGKRIGVEKNWVNQTFLEYLLNKNNIDLKDVELVNLDESDGGMLMLQNKIDGAVMWEPWLSRVIKLSPAHILASTEKESVIVDVLVGSKEFLEDKESEIKKITEVLFEVKEIINNNVKQSADIISTYLGITKQEATEQLKKVLFFDKKDNFSYLENKKNSISVLEKIKKELEEVIKTNEEHNYKIITDEYFDKRFIL
ncbi:MAG: ABC-type nitrate/sulfonate/bicarbonate transport system, ATPase component [Candidatus Magasanikbacteria bacterium GW2011_GWC2_37_14]|uniref:ABC-type nitrate/sulfonate/bicarbonate transport system, ATPase component n=1 Tax=Candidatus Magasanikbacteria bacterium GW2011_GWC2_37_14 TaxID=1619046 RepID=A0A0G0GQ05_9BACT|nr:MAG: ABC-type nitrate/sulfonate/bicarbonate transport system, ATPase component [Candidatus Magasanikbacteria bacterium GW2011_GWC2_37_14]